MVSTEGRARRQMERASLAGPGMPSNFATVVIPCLNSAETLGACLSAVDAQALRHRLWVVVIDNGSVDSSFRIAQRFADEAVVVRARGSAAARNHGLSLTAT